MLEWVDEEIAAALKRIERNIDRRLHFAARSAGQKKRRKRERKESSLTVSAH